MASGTTAALVNETEAEERDRVLIAIPGMLECTQWMEQVVHAYIGNAIAQHEVLSDNHPLFRRQVHVQHIRDALQWLNQVLRQHPAVQNNSPIDRLTLQLDEAISQRVECAIQLRAAQVERDTAIHRARELEISNHQLRQQLDLLYTRLATADFPAVQHHGAYAPAVRSPLTRSDRASPSRSEKPSPSRSAKVPPPRVATAPSSSPRLPKEQPKQAPCSAHDSPKPCDLSHSPKHSPSPVHYSVQRSPPSQLRKLSPLSIHQSPNASSSKQTAPNFDYIESFPSTASTGVSTLTECLPPIDSLGLSREARSEVAQRVYAWKTRQNEREMNGEMNRKARAKDEETRAKDENIPRKDVEA